MLAVFGWSLTSASAQAAYDTTRRVLVTYKPQKPGQAHAAAVLGSAARAGGRLAMAPVGEIGMAVVRPGAGQSIADLKARLARDPAISSVRVERRYKLRLAPNDSAFATQLPNAPVGTNEEWWAAGMGLPAAWDITFGNTARVAVIDTGVDATHPDFAGKILKTIDLDDERGHGDARQDEIGHGTHVASLACAVPNNGYGIAGAGFNCKLLVAKTDLSEGSIAAAIVWAVKNKADAINMSFGTDRAGAPSTAIKRAVEYAFKRDVVLVAAAADEPRSEQGDPANLLQPTGTGARLSSHRARGLTVTAARADNQRAVFAGRGSQISVAAYGTYGETLATGGLLGAFPTNRTDIEAGSFTPPPTSPCGCRVTINGDPRFARLQGTSMAAPLVSGVAAMIKAYNHDLSAAEVAQIIKRTAKRDGGWNSDTGWGVIDAAKALRTARRTDRRAPRSKIRSLERLAGGTVRLAWQGRDRGPGDIRVSGIAHYDVYKVSGDGRPVRIRRTRRTSASVPAVVGDAFFTVAIDRAGNEELAPRRADVVLGPA